jgi:hypothetical protein
MVLIDMILRSTRWRHSALRISRIPIGAGSSIRLSIPQKIRSHCKKYRGGKKVSATETSADHMTLYELFCTAA